MIRNRYEIRQCGSVYMSQELKEMLPSSLVLGLVFGDCVVFYRDSSRRRVRSARLAYCGLFTAHELTELFFFRIRYKTASLTYKALTGNVTSAGWQVTLCDPIRHVSYCSGETL